MMNPSKKTKIFIVIIAFAVLYVALFAIAYAQKKTPEETLDAYMHQRFSQEDKVMPSVSVLVVDNGEIVYEKSFGYANIDTMEKATPATNYRIASDSKMFTAMCIMILKDRGMLDYDTKVCDILEDFPEYGKDITVMNLIKHTSGLYDFYNHVDLLDKTIDDEHQALDSDVYEIVKKMDSTEFKPGTQFHYVDTGYILLGLIVEKVSGQTLTDFMAENIFEPLEMNNSLMYDIALNQNVKNRAYGTEYNETEYITKDQNYSSATRGDGGVYTSLEDYYKWDRALYTDALVSRETLEEAYVAEGIFNVADRFQYNFGWMFKTNSKGVMEQYHYGSTQGSSSVYYRIPKENRAIIVLSNKYDDEWAYVLPEKISDIYGFGKLW